ncbi:hypothetical protein CTA1_3824, partial [Colletotrichum tanaceti]
TASTITSEAASSQFVAALSVLPQSSRPRDAQASAQRDGKLGTGHPSMKIALAVTRSSGDEGKAVLARTRFQVPRIQGTTFPSFVTLTNVQYPSRDRWQSRENSRLLS